MIKKLLNWIFPKKELTWRRPTDYRHGDDAWISSPMDDVMYAVASVDGEFWTAAVAVGCYNPYELWFDGVTVREAKVRCEEHWMELKRNGYGKDEN